MGIVSLSGGGPSPDMRALYTEDGDLNVFLLGTDIPYGNQSEAMQEDGLEIRNLQARQQHYYDWQQLMMDKIVPMLPLFTPRSYVGTWANTLGYEGRWGIVDSLPYIEYDGYHAGQESQTEFRIADANWRELNPMFIGSYPFYEFIGEVLNEEIVMFSPDFAPLKTGLFDDWEQIDEFQYKFYMRDNVYWNPSYNITARDEYSPPLDSIPTTQLVRGLKNNEYSNGTNQQVTAKDAVFTFLLWSNSVISESTSYHEWISNIYVDPVDPLAFHIHIDEDPATPELEYYPEFWERINWIIMPEFFLNSTDPTISYTSGGVKCSGLYPSMIASPQWRMYSLSQFGCGKYMLDYRIYNDKTVLRASPYWMGVGAIDGEVQDLGIDTIIVEVIADSSDELASFISGKLDWCGLTHFPAIRKQLEADPRFTVHSMLSPSMSFLFFNLRRPFIGGADNFVYLDAVGKQEYTKGVAVRKAINYAIDRDEMNHVLHDGDYFVAQSVLYPFTAYYYYNDVIKYNYDLNAAKEWLIAAGFPFQIDHNYYDSCGSHHTVSETETISVLGTISLLAIIVLISNLSTRIFSRKKRK